MHLSAIFKDYGVDVKKTKLVRHPLNKEEVSRQLSVIFG